MSDGHVEDAGAEALRAAVLVASRLGDQVARLRENALRHAEAESAQRSRDLQTRLDAERLAARAQLEVIDRPGWWDTARPEQIGEVYQTARSWQAMDPQIATAAARIEHELEPRYGIDVAHTDASPDRVRQALEAVVAAQGLADDRDASAKRLEARAAQLLLDADGLASSREGAELTGTDLERDVVAEQAVRDQAHAILADAGDERSAADHYTGIADREAREARILADKGQPIPAQEATANVRSSAKAPKPRRGPVRAQEQSLQR